MNLRGLYGPKLEARIFTASMADIVFLLIVFFLLTLQGTADRTQMELPTTFVRMEVPDRAALISIAPPEDGQLIRVAARNAVPLRVESDAQLESFVALVLAADPDREFVIRADREVSWERVDAVLDILKRSRARVIFLMSEQAAVE